MTNLTEIAPYLEKLTNKIPNDNLLQSFKDKLTPFFKEKVESTTYKKQLAELLKVLDSCPTKYRQFCYVLTSVTLTFHKSVDSEKASLLTLGCIALLERNFNSSYFTFPQAHSHYMSVSKIEEALTSMNKKAKKLDEKITYFWTTSHGSVLTIGLPQFVACPLEQGSKVMKAHNFHSATSSLPKLLEEQGIHLARNSNNQLCFTKRSFLDKVLKQEDKELIGL